MNRSSALGEATFEIKVHFPSTHQGSDLYPCEDLPYRHPDPLLDVDPQTEPIQCG